MSWQVLFGKFQLLCPWNIFRGYTPVICVSIPASCPEVLYPHEAEVWGRIHDRGTGCRNGYRNNCWMILLSYTYSVYTYINHVRLYIYLKYIINTYLLEPEGSYFLNHLLLNLLNVKNAKLILIGSLNFEHFRIGWN